MQQQELNQGLIFTNSNCIGCNKCISGCIATGANVVVMAEGADRFHVAVDPNKCILCGRCLTECLHDARTFKDDTDEFFAALERGESISVLVASSLLSDYEKQYNNILGYLKQLGVRHIYNTSFGADIMVWEYINFIQDFGLKGVISQFCPVIVNYLEKYKPELLSYLMPVQSPMMCTAIYVSDYLKIPDKLAYISPCVASKQEIQDVNTYDKVSYNVTFTNLMKRLAQVDISGCYAEDEVGYGLGGLASMAGGLSANMELFIGFDEVLIQTTGPDNIFPYFDHYSKEVTSNGELPFLVDVLNCTNGCNFGTGTSCGVEQRNQMAFSAHRAKEKAYRSGNVPTGRDHSTRIAKLNQRFADFELSSFVRQYDMTRKVQSTMLSDQEMDGIFNSMCKSSAEQRNTDCGACGYKTCKDMVYAIGTGINIRENCINYAKERIRQETEKTNSLLEEISTMNEELKNATQLKSNFLANMSHEIRTPMNAVIGMAEMVLRSDLPDEERQYIQQIKSSGRSLLAIINDVLDFSKIESGKMEINETEYAVMSIINDTVNIVMSRLGEKDISLVVDADPEIPFALYGDDIRIKQVLVNFANNAVKFTQSGFVELSMQYERCEEGVMLRVAIRDSGVGIKPEDMKKLFTSFQQVDSKRNRNIEGTGLGLAISREFVRLMGGNIDVESTYGEGSTFSFCIPQRIVEDRPSVSIKSRETVKLASCIRNQYVRDGLAKAVAKLDVQLIKCFSLEDIGKAVEAGAAYVFIDYPLWNERIKSYAANQKAAQFVVVVDPRKEFVTEPYVRKLNQPLYSQNVAAVLNNEIGKLCNKDTHSEDFRFEAPEADILIVDDNEINLTVAKGLLSPLNMRITCAGGAREAIRLVESNPYDIVFMDHMMPDIDGVEATRIIRGMDGDYFKSLPIIALTANAVNNAREMFLSEGMNDFVAKPIDMLDMIAKLKKWLPPDKIKKVGLVEESAEKDEDGDLPQIEGLDVKAGAALAGSAVFYRKILADYYNVIEKKAALIEGYAAQGNIKSYTIEVHSLKSASRIVGAGKLADMAARLERCGNENDTAAIETETPVMLNLYRAYLPLLEPHCKVESIEAVNEIAPEQLAQKLTEMYDALDDFDIDTARELVDTLLICRFGTEETSLLEQLHTAVKELEYEVAMELAEKWKTLRGL